MKSFGSNLDLQITLGFVGGLFLCTWNVGVGMAAIAYALGIGVGRSGSL
jgi:hypothetical protein